MSSYPAVPLAVSVSADQGADLRSGVMVAVRLCDLVSPLGNGALAAEGDRSALAVAGAEKIRTGDVVVFCKVVAAAPAVVTRKGQVRAGGSPVRHARLGPAEEWLGAHAGPGVTGAIAGRAVPGKRYVKGAYDRLLTAAFMIGVIAAQSLMRKRGCLT